WWDRRAPARYRGAACRAVAPTGAAGAAMSVAARRAARQPPAGAGRAQAARDARGAAAAIAPGRSIRAAPARRTAGPAWTAGARRPVAQARAGPATRALRAWAPAAAASRR